MTKRQSRVRSRHASSRGPRTPGGAPANPAYRTKTGPIKQPLSTEKLANLRFGADVSVWVIAMAAGAFSMGASLAHGLIAGGVAAAGQAIVGAAGGLYKGRWKLASFDEAVALTGVVSVVAVGLAAIRVAAAMLGFTAAISLLAPFIALSTMVTLRGLRRFQLERQAVTAAGAGRTPVLVFGAGDGGEQVVRAMLGNPNGAYVPVALLDDAPAKQNLRLQGVPVAGTRADLAAVAAVTGCELLVIAIPNAGARTIESVAALAEDAGLEVRVVPPTQELVDGVIRLGDIREVSEADLLGRRTIDTDVSAIASYLTGARVLVTGAGGSIGSELCRQIATFSPEQLVMLDRDESGLHATQLSIEGHGLLDSDDLVVADIRDSDRLKEVFSVKRPEVVFHAAALKHLPLLERYPEEGWKTNVLGTNNVLRAAATHGVTHFVNVSTDKAAEPTSVLGYTKRIAEQLTSWYAHRTRGDWVSVRFGNVLGSRGSMLTAFRAQVAAGGPITVTDPEATRYFMTPHEACELVIQAGAVGAKGEALVLDMGEPVRILDVAQRLAKSASVPIDIVFTGLRPGEKLHEDLIANGELDIRRAHPLISHVAVPALRPTNLGLFNAASPEAAIRSLSELCSSVPETIQL